MNTKDRITRARIQIQQQNSFFAYLSLYLKFKEVEKGQMEIDTMGVDVEGNVYYVKEFIEKLSDEELKGVIIHEIGHLVFLTELRRKSRDKLIWNCATDLAINSILKNNNFKLPDGCIIPDGCDEFEVGFGKKIKECSKKTAEELYDEFPKVEQKGKDYYVVSDGKKEKIGEKLDDHIKSKKNGQELTENEKKGLAKEWKNRTEEALTISKMKGDLPSGIERMVGRLKESKINWKALLNQYITKQIPYDYTYSRPSKKSISVGTYMPDVLKEKIEIDVMVDLSGSVGQKEYDEFMSEVIAIAKAYQEQLTMRVYSHDTECYDNGLIHNGNIEKLKKMNLKGGGGTSFKSPIKYLKENNINPKCLIWLTDGWGDEFEKPNFPLLWVLTKDGSEEYIKNKGVVIKID